jgi:RHS repeat-associated protein
VSGTTGTTNPTRFSSKYEDPLTGLINFGFRDYSPLLGRWLSRDPIEEMTWFTAVSWLAKVGVTPELFPSPNTHNPYHFVFNGAVNSTDDLGLQRNGDTTKEGDPCNCSSCTLSAKFERVSVTPTLISGGLLFWKKRATSWSITVKVTYSASGDCVVLGCKYWTCNKLLPRGTPTAYIQGSCGSWTYNVGGPLGADYHAKAMEGVIEYLSCENSKYVKKELSAGSLQNGFYYNPAEVWSENKRIYP